MAQNTRRQRPKIAHVLHSLDRAGAEVLACQLVATLGTRFDFVFFCLDHPGILATQLQDRGLAVHVLHRRPGLDLPLARRLAQLGRAHRVDLWHAHQYTPFAYTALARLAAGRTSRRWPILLTEHGRHYPDITSRRRRLANRLLLGRRDRITAVGRFVANALAAHDAMPRRRIEVIYNGVAPWPTTATPDQLQRQARRKLPRSLPDGAKLVMQVARFAPVKDHGTALRGFAKLASRRTDVHLVLIGDGGGLAAAKSLAERLGVADRVVFAGQRADVRDLLPAADVFMLSSLSEGVSVTLLEAMAAGLPIAATDVGGNREVVAHGRTGLLSPRSDAEALASNLGRLLDDPTLRHRLGHAGAMRWRQRFTEADMHARYDAIYRQMTAAPTRPGRRSAWPAPAVST